ncbi:MAG: alpha/beta hydrolase [Gammaproteobacteria bacterium]|nr:alpha/beta hydrolase [Gammaproteobacteria bacterium]
MTNQLIYTSSKARLAFVQKNGDENYRWLFLPGGPGLGSETLKALVALLDLPGEMWLLDLPGDGSNIGDDKSFLNWQQGLIEATTQFENTILVAHSTGGMFALSTPEIEKNLIGLVLMNCAPNADFQKSFLAFATENPLPDSEKLQAQYDNNPSDDLLKALTIAHAPYCATKHYIEKIKNLFGQLPFNCKAHLLSEKIFDSSYEAKWIPEKIPTLIFAGDQDYITPLKLFSDAALFHRDNISICEIKNAAHFPWIDNPEAVKLLFQQYLKKLGVNKF